MDREVALAHSLEEPLPLEVYDFSEESVGERDTTGLEATKASARTIPFVALGIATPCMGSCYSWSCTGPPSFQIVEVHVLMASVELVRCIGYHEETFYKYQEFVVGIYLL